MELDPSAYEDSMHRIITTLVSPRPIGWISTRDDERDNLAPYSYFNVVSTSPPVVMFSGSTDDGEPKDAGRMAVETGEFVVNLVTEDLASQMDATSAPLDDVSEFDFVGLERAEAKTVDAPRVAAAAACLECTLYDTKEIHDNLVVFGAVEHISVDERLTTDGVVDMEKADSVGRLGGPYYTRIDVLDVERTNFGPWDGQSPPGFTVDDETGRLVVDPDRFREIRSALSRVVEDESVGDVVEATGLDAETLAESRDRRALYLDGSAADERIEAALAEAGFATSFSYES
ncbi:MAG: flavin reductase family protein [Halolamina sp.]|uniref:flavin reductase family protein n=1 Tax=Halolamina sp. TaxID=1940283 RepID=UPI002FC3BD34